MAAVMSRLRGRYGAGVVHLFATVASLTLAAYVVRQLGLSALWSSEVWWKSIAVWFIGAVVVHDLVLFPAYALLDRLAVRSAQPRGRSLGPGVPVLNYIRIPAMAIALLGLLFFPGILQHGSRSYELATGQTQDPFAERWLLLSAGIVTVSMVVYVIRRGARRATHEVG